MIVGASFTINFNLKFLKTGEHQIAAGVLGLIFA